MEAIPSSCVASAVWLCSIVQASRRCCKYISKRPSWSKRPGGVASISAVAAVFAAAEGDTLRTWRIDPFIMIEGGQAWVPPAMLAADIEAGG